MKHLLSLALMGAGACALCVMPSFQKHPLQRKFFHRCFAHRGLFDNQTRCENSLSAFEAAAQAGYGIELDLQMTADGKIVVFHDDDLQRMCSSPLVIEQATYAQLQEYNLGETFEKIPLFSQVLAQVNGRVPLIVEIKSTERIERTCLKVYDLLRNYPGDYCIESMNPLIMGWFAKNEPQIMRGQLATHIPSKGNPLTAISSAALGGMMFNILSKPHFIAYDHRSARAVVRSPLAGPSVSKIMRQLSVNMTPSSLKAFYLRHAFKKFYKPASGRTSDGCPAAFCLPVFNKSPLKM